MSAYANVVSDMLYRALRLGVFLDWLSEIIEVHLRIDREGFSGEFEDEFSAGVPLGATDKIVIYELFRLLHPSKDGYLDTIRMKIAKDCLQKQLISGATHVDFLDLVDIGDFTAAFAFRSAYYQLRIIDTETELFCTSQRDGELKSQFFSRDRPESWTDALSTAILDAPDPAGVPLHTAFFCPAADTICSVRVPRGVVVYEGIAAPLDAIIPIDALATKVSSPPPP